MGLGSVWHRRLFGRRICSLYLRKFSNWFFHFSGILFELNRIDSLSKFHTIVPKVLMASFRCDENSEKRVLFRKFHRLTGLSTFVFSGLAKNNILFFKKLFKNN